MRQFQKQLTIAGYTLAAITILLFWHEAIFAADDLKTVSNRIQENIVVVANLLVIVAYVSGVGFALAGIVQFKAHKDNPAQVPLSKPLVYIAVGAFLLFLPQLLKSAGQTIFGTTEDSGATGSTGL